MTKVLGRNEQVQTMSIHITKVGLDWIKPKYTCNDILEILLLDDLEIVRYVCICSVI